MDFSDLIKRFSKLKVMVVGDVMLDTYLYGSVSRISPEAPVPVVAIEKKDQRPGGAANVALNIKSLGATPVLCSMLGNDDAGKSLLKILKQNKISSAGIISSKSRITTTKTRVLSRNHQMIRYDSEMTSDLSNEDEKNLIQKIKSFIVKEKPHALIFEDYNKGVLTEKVIGEIITVCKTKNILTAVDPKRKNFFAYKNVDVFKPNLREIREALNDDIHEVSKEKLISVSKKLEEQLSQSITLITLSEHGIFFHSEKENIIIPAHKRDVADVSGAGDTVIAVITLCLAAGLSVHFAADLANIAGGLVCEQVGVVPITKELLKKEFETTN